MFVNGNDNVIDNYNSNTFIFTIKDTKLFIIVITSLAKHNQKLVKLLSKGFGRSVHWNEYKAKSEKKNSTNEYRFFLKSNLVGVIDIIYQRELWAIIMSSSMEKTFMINPFWYKTIWGN